MNVSEKLAAIKAWFDWQHYDLTCNIKGVADAEKLYDYFKEHTELSDGCDYAYRNEWEREVMSEDHEAMSLAWHVVQAIGYDPLGEL